MVRPEVEGESTGGQKYLPLADGSFLAQGYAPTKHTVKMKVKTDVKNITAFRLELLNDPNLPRGGPGRSIQGTAALSEFAVEAPRSAARPSKLKFAKATADCNPPETPLDPMYDDKSGKKRLIGPVSFAIDGNNDTAWATDGDPGRRNQPHQAVFTLDKPLANPDGTTLTFLLTQNHGGWNSDDNQNHNLGRFRLSLTTAPGAEADPVPPAVRQILALPRDKRTPEQDAAVFGYWRTTVAEWADANKHIEDLWKQYPEGTTQLVLTPRDQPRDTHLLKRGNFLKPGAARRSGRAGVPQSAAGRRTAQPADAGPMACRSQGADDGRARSSTASGRCFSGSASWPRRRTWACRANRRRIPNCSTGWPWSSWTQPSPRGEGRVSGA